MYFIILAILYIFTYFFLTYFLQIFFNWKISETKFNLFHIWIILVLYFFFIIFANSLENVELWNRIQHMFWWWFMMVVIFFFSTFASKIKLTKIQFFVLAMLITTAFWVVNELAESIFQIGKVMLFSTNIADTWLDLWSNSIWALIWSLIFVFFIRTTWNK